MVDKEKCHPVQLESQKKEISVIMKGQTGHMHRMNPTKYFQLIVLTWKALGFS